MKKSLLAAMLLWLPPAAQADELFSPSEKKKMMEVTLETFWGKAVDSEGKPIEPKDDAERKTLPISEQQGFYIIDKGAETGLAEWCKIQWDSRFELMMKQQRAQLKNDTQAAYAGVLHGMAQAMMLRSLEKDSCDADTKDQVAQLIESDVKNLKKSLAGNDK